jgi:hypothetical protein
MGVGFCDFEDGSFVSILSVSKLWVDNPIPDIRGQASLIPSLNKPDKILTAQFMYPTKDVFIVRYRSLRVDDMHCFWPSFGVYQNASFCMSFKPYRRRGATHSAKPGSSKTPLKP